MTHTTNTKMITNKRVPVKKFLVRNTLISGLTGRLQIFELKQLADMEAGYRAKCKQAIEVYKNWQLQHKAETDMIELLYGGLEGRMLRAQAEDMVRMYWVIRQDFRRAFKEYLAKSCCYPARYSQSQAA